MVIFYFYNYLKKKLKILKYSFSNFLIEQKNIVNKKIKAIIKSNNKIL